MSRALLIDGGAGQSHGLLSTARLLAEGGADVHVTASGRFSPVAWSRHVKAVHAVPCAEERGFRATIEQLVDEVRYDLVLATSDAALIALGRPEARLVDKGELARCAEAAGMPQAREETFADGAALRNAADRLTYPVVVKSAEKFGDGNLGVRRFDSPTQLRAAATDVSYRVSTQAWLSGGTSSVAGVIWDGRWRAVVHQGHARTWPVDHGVSAVALTVTPDRGREERLLELVGDVQGLVQIQLIGEHVIDVNPRPYGSVMLGRACGVSLPDIAMRLSTGRPPVRTGLRDADADGVVRAPAGARYRWVEGDVRAAFTRVRSGNWSVGTAVQALRPRRGTVHADVWLSDPLPTLARLAFAADPGSRR